MAAHEVHLSAFTVVAAGIFTPEIFQPKWMFSQGLLTSAVEKAAKVEAITPNVTSFSADWLRFVCLNNQIAISTTLENALPSLKDLAIGIFSSVTRSSITAIAINYEAHFEIPTQDAWHKFGHLLTPKECWKGILDSPGMRNIQMQGARSDKLGGSINVSVQPSVKMSPGKFGVYILVNDHVDKDTDLETFDAVDALTTIWKQSIDRSKNIASALMKLT